MSGLTFKVWRKWISGIRLALPRRALGWVVAVALILVGQALVSEGLRLFAGATNSVTWDAVFASIQHDWPEVPQMSTPELAQRMAAGKEAAPLLIDVRTREEYEVSHLPGAVWAETSNQISAALKTASDTKTVVLYCSA